MYFFVWEEKPNEYYLKRQIYNLHGEKRFSFHILLSSLHSLSSHEEKQHRMLLWKTKSFKAMSLPCHERHKCDKSSSIAQLLASHNESAGILTQTAVWSETPMQLVEPALTKHTAPLITQRVLP